MINSNEIIGVKQSLKDPDYDDINSIDIKEVKKQRTSRWGTSSTAIVTNTICESSSRINYEVSRNNSESPIFPFDLIPIERKTSSFKMPDNPSDEVENEEEQGNFLLSNAIPLKKSTSVPGIKISISKSKLSQDIPNTKVEDTIMQNSEVTMYKNNEPNSNNSLLNSTETAVSKEKSNN